MAKRILIVDDEPRYLRLLEANLRTEGYEVVTASDGAQAVDVFSNQPIDLVLMDVMMPKLDGFGATQRIREFSNIPIIILTAKGDEQDRVRGLDLGADDYLVKPFSLREVEARLASLHRRHAGKLLPRPLAVGVLHLDPRTATLSCNGQPVKLPPKSLRLIETMMRDPERVFSRTDLEGAVWGGEPITNDTLRSQMYLLRRAIALAGGGDPIQNLHGLGYRLVVKAASPTER